MLSTLKLKLLALRHDCQGENLIEYALTAGFAALVAGAIMSDLLTQLGDPFAKTKVVMGEASTNRQSIMQIICVILAVLFLGLIVLRRKSQRNNNG
jgi:Flp pilus assembly pilin Flp